MIKGAERDVRLRSSDVSDSHAVMRAEHANTSLVDVVPASKHRCSWQLKAAGREDRNGRRREYMPWTQQVHTFTSLWRRYSVASESNSCTALYTCIMQAK